MTFEKSITVLIVDDDEDDRFFMHEALKADSTSTQVHLAADGQQALDMLFLMHPAPDVILLDLNMPGLSGFEVLDHLKQSPRHQSIPVIILTTSSAGADQDQAGQLGAIDFITKPTTQSGLSAIARQVRLNWSK